ncbi:MAG: hypothetical protein ACK493_09610 [Planctomycetota bacterium]|jgi:hypothetical protein
MSPLQLPDLEVPHGFDGHFRLLSAALSGKVRNALHRPSGVRARIGSFLYDLPWGLGTKLATGSVFSQQQTGAWGGGRGLAMLE